MIIITVSILIALVEEKKMYIPKNKGKLKLGKIMRSTN